MKKVIPTTAYVLKIDSEIPEGDLPTAEHAMKIMSHARLVNRGLMAWMFLPMGEHGEPLEKHLMFPANMQGAKDAANHMKKYQQAKDCMLFEGFELTFSEKEFLCAESDSHTMVFNKGTGKYVESMEGVVTTVESLAQCDIELTETGIAEVGS